MGSIMDSRYWVCPHCCTQFDWEDKKNGPGSHDKNACKQNKSKKSVKEDPPVPVRLMGLTTTKPLLITLEVRVPSTFSQEDIDNQRINLRELIKDQTFNVISATVLGGVTL